MSKKDYIKFVDLLARHKPNEYVSPYSTRQNIVEGMASIFKVDNVAFDKERFLEACGLNPSSE